MEKRKVIPLEAEYQDKGSINVIKEVEQGLEAIDKNSNINTPNLEWFGNLIVEQKQNMRKKLLKDIGIFSVIALFVLSAVIFTLYQLPLVFFAMQGIVAVFIVIYCTITFVKQVNET